VWGREDDVGDAEAIEIAVPRLPRISNFTDLEPLAREPGVRVRFVPPDGSLDGTEAVVLPGSKNTVDDLLALTDGGLAAEIRAFDGLVVGLCGGYQMLGQRIRNAGVESMEDIETVDGLGLLPVETVFSAEKQVERVQRSLDGEGPLAGASGTVTGYEIHMGSAQFIGETLHPVGPESAATDRVLGTYLHGLFENENARAAFLERVAAAGDLSRPDEVTDDRNPFDAAATLVDENLELQGLGLGLDRVR